MLKKLLRFFTIILTFTILATFAKSAFAAATCSQADINQDGTVNITDYSLLVNDFLSSSPQNARTDINSDNKVDITDYSLLVSQFLNTCNGSTSPTPSPTASPSPTPTPSTNTQVTLFSAGSWNIPASQLATDTSRQSLVNLLYTKGATHHDGNFNLSWNGYTYPIYYANSQTPKYTVNSSHPSWSNIDGELMPLDPSWEPSNGSDAQIIVLDESTNTYYEVWQYQGIQNNQIRVSNGSVIHNYPTHSGINGPSRGCGIAYAAMLIRPEEVEAGVIPHALSMPVNYTDKSFVAPAVKSDGQESNGIPMGTRFALTMTDQQIQDYANSKPQHLRNYARIVATALRDYGWIITDSSGGAHIQMEDAHSAQAKWEALGLKLNDPNSELSNLLDGLDWQSAKVLEAR